MERYRNIFKQAPVTEEMRWNLNGMKEENTLRYTLEELEKIPDETDWERVKQMTDEEVKALAKEAPDAQP